MMAEFTKIDAVTSHDRNEMFSLMEDHFEHMRRSRFEQDLSEKDWVLLVKDHGRVVGFTTIRLSKAKLTSGDALVIYSGDTLVSPKCRMDTTFVRGWFAGMRYLQSKHPELNLYWLLLCSGFRTYRFMPVYWNAFFPRYDIPTPVPWQHDIDLLAGIQFGHEYNKETGVVRFTHPQVLRVAIRDIPEGRHENPHIRFFAHKNSGHAEGDELVCLTRIGHDNLTRAGQRLWNCSNLSFKVTDHESEV